MSTNDPTPSPDTPAANGFSEGQKLAGCYALLRRLTMAGGPEIWLANDEVLGKDVSLHFLPAAVIKDARTLQELRQDIKRNRQLIHPQILRVYDLIEEPGWAAVSMNAFEGESVAARLGQKPDKRFAASEIESWAFALAQTVDDAHKIQFLHRDLAPENLFLTQAGQLLIANFGISRTIQEALARAGQADAAHSAYMSPQTLDGVAPARTDDVYSLGAILYTAVVGKAPFTGADIAGQVRAGLTAPAIAALETPELQVPPAWRSVIIASLQKSPEGRPQTAGEFLKILKGEAEAPKPVDSPASAPAPVPVAIPATAPVPAPVPEPAAAAISASVAPASVVPAPVVEPLPAVVEKPAVVEAPVVEKPVIAEKPATEKPAVAAPVVETLPIEPKPVAKAEAAPVVPAPLDEDELFAIPGKKVESGPAPQPGKIEKLEASLAPEPEVEIIESQALAELAKAKWKEEPTRVPPPAQPEPKKPFNRPPLKDFKPRLYPEESRFPIVGIGIAAAFLLAAIIYHLSTKKSATPEEAVAPPANVTPANFTPAPTPEKIEIRALNITPVPPKVVINPTPVPAPTPSPAMERAVAERQAALDKAKAEADAAEKAHAELLEQQKLAEVALAESQKSLEEKTKASGALKAAVDGIAAQRKKLEDSQKAAEAAADAAQKAAAEAQKAAEDKARLAEEGKKSLADFQRQSEEQSAAQQKAAAELQSVQAALAEKQRLAAEATKAASNAEAARQQQLAALTKGEQEVDSARAALALQRSVNNKLADLRSSAGSAPDTGPRASLAGPTPIIMHSAPTPAPAPATPPPATPVPRTPVPATPVPSTPVPATPVPSTPAPATPLPSTPAPRTPMPITPAPTYPATAVAANTASGANSLGLKFAPVGDVEFAIWLTRVKDFEVFAKAVNLRSTSWLSPGFKQAADHPVVNVTWLEAMAFCKWLTDKEHKEGTLPDNQFYRLPMDMEWSKAVGLPDESGKTAEQRDMDVPEVYPWGTGWPPPSGAGNYTGEETGSDVAIKGYDDGFAWTSPVGSFKPNKYGLYDMGGNVWQWCMDNWNTESKAKVLRGASWYNGALKLSLLSSCRVHAAPDSSTDNYGFRIVRASEGSAGVKSKFR